MIFFVLVALHTNHCRLYIIHPFIGPSLSLSLFPLFFSLSLVAFLVASYSLPSTLLFIYADIHYHLVIVFILFSPFPSCSFIYPSLYFPSLSSLPSLLYLTENLFGVLSALFSLTRVLFLSLFLSKGAFKSHNHRSECALDIAHNSQLTFTRNDQP